MLTRWTLPMVMMWLSIAAPAAWAITPEVDDSETASELEESSKPSQLSIPPLDHVQFPADRPAWIDTIAQPSQNDGAVETFEIAITSGPVDSAEKAEEMMMFLARGAVANYLEARLRDNHLDLAVDAITVDDHWIGKELITRRYEGTLTVGGEPAFEHAALLKFNATQLAYLEAQVREMQLRHRLAAVGLVGVVGLGGLMGGSIVLGGLATRQRRRKVVPSADAVA